MCEICSQLTKKTPERVFTINFEQISRIVLVSRFWLSTNKCRLDICSEYEKIQTAVYVYSKYTEYGDLENLGTARFPQSFLAMWSVYL